MLSIPKIPKINTPNIGNFAFPFGAAPVKVPETMTRLSQSLALVGYHQTNEEGSYADVGNALASAWNGLAAGGTALKDALMPFTKGAQQGIGGGIVGAAVTAGKLAAGAASGVGSVLENPLLSFRPIGAAYGFEVKQSRTNARGYGINSSVETFRIMPGPVTTDITIKQMMLYIQDFMFSTGFITGAGNIAFQTRPLVIQELQHVPIGVAEALRRALLGKPSDITKVLTRWLEQVSPAGLPVANTYINCWIKDSQISYSLEDDQAVSQDVNLDAGQVSGLSVVAGVVSGAAVTGFRGLAKNIALNIGKSAVKGRF